jgi:hypothetical protein
MRPEAGSLLAIDLVRLHSDPQDFRVRVDVFERVLVVAPRNPQSTSCMRYFRPTWTSRTRPTSHIALLIDMLESQMARSASPASNLAWDLFVVVEQPVVLAAMSNEITVAVLLAVVYIPNVVYTDACGPPWRFRATRGPRRPQRRRQAGVARESHNVYLRAATV